MKSYIELLRLILPEFLIESFNLTSFKNLGGSLHLYFNEKSIIPKEFAAIELVSKGFSDEITIQNFPLGSRFVYLHIKKQHWIDKVTGEIMRRDWTLVASRANVVEELTLFLKEIQ